MERSVDECSDSNGGCGDERYIDCNVRLWTTYRYEEGNLTKIKVPLNWTSIELPDGSTQTNVTEWEFSDITYEENQTRVDELVARGAPGAVHTLDACTSSGGGQRVGGIRRQCSSCCECSIHAHRARPSGSAPPLSDACVFLCP
eukprot:COSAG05_NODE_8407_length_706_cov_1.654036_1_plen_143_part_10